MNASLSAIIRIILSTVFLVSFYSVTAQVEIWTGDTILFEKPNNADFNLSQNQDRINDSVWITRKSNKSIFNIRIEPEAGPSSPVKTLWAFGSSDTFRNLTFKTWNLTHANKPQSTIGKDMVLFIPEDSLVIDVEWVSFSGSSSGGGISYIRTTPLKKRIEITMDVRDCNYRLPKGRLITSSGFYLDTVSGFNVDTVYRVQFTNIGPDPSFDVIGNTFHAKAVGEYQWMTCDNGFVPIADANGSFYPTASTGKFALEVSANGCIDTSECYEHSSLNIPLIVRDQINVSPNPATDQLNIEFTNRSFVDIELWDKLGRTVIQKRFINGNKVQIDVSNFNSGLYWLVTHGRNGKTFIRKVMIH